MRTKIIERCLIMLNEMIINPTKISNWEKLSYMKVVFEQEKESNILKTKGRMLELKNE